MIRTTLYRVLVVLLLAGPFARTESSFQCKAEINELAADLYHRYGLRVIPEFTRPISWNERDRISAERADPIEIYRVLRELQLSLAGYPVEFVKRTVFKNISVCKNLSAQDGSFAGMTDHSCKTLYLGADALVWGRPVLRKNIHHEIFHMIDFADDGKMDDDLWSRLNDPAFTYGAESNKGKSDLPGFLGEYATSDVAEDKAELFSSMKSTPEKVAARAKTDLILERKMKAMSSLLERYDSQFRFGPFDDSSQ